MGLKGGGGESYVYANETEEKYGNGKRVARLTQIPQIENCRNLCGFYY